MYCPYSRERRYETFNDLTNSNLMEKHEYSIEKIDIYLIQEPIFFIERKKKRFQ